MRKWLIETLVISIAVGVFMLYGQPLVDWIQNLFGLEASTYLYAAVATGVVVFATLTGKILTRGMK